MEDDESPTEFEKWWFKYSKGRINTRDENIAQTAWDAAILYHQAHILAYLALHFSSNDPESP